MSEDGNQRLCVCGKRKSVGHFLLTDGYAKCFRQATEKANQRYAAAKQAQIVCPHCQKPGNVTRREAKQKRGVSGGKATAAVLTGGVSMLGTGLSRKQNVQVLTCGNCGITWTVDK